MKSLIRTTLLAAIAAVAVTAATAAGRSGYTGTVGDFVEISQLFARYNAAVDTRDGRAWAATFTPDGIFQDARRCVVGRAALEVLIGSSPMPGRDQQRFHMQSLGPILYTGRTAATVRSPIIVVESSTDSATGGRLTPAVADDVLQRVGGRWLIARRIVHIGSDAIARNCN